MQNYLIDGENRIKICCLVSEDLADIQTDREESAERHFVLYYVGKTISSNSLKHLRDLN